MKSVFVVGYYGFKSTGDDAIKLGTDNVLKNNEDIYSLDYLGSPLDSLQHFLEATDVVLGGGTHIRDWGKGWFGQSARIATLAVMSRLFGKKFHMLNVGIDAEKLAAKMIAGITKKLSKTVSIRDRDSFDSAVLMSNDLTWLRQTEETKTIGVNLARVNEIYYGNRELDNGISDRVCETLAVWIKKNPEYKVKFISFNGRRSPYGDNDINQNACITMNSYVKDCASYVEFKSNPCETLNEIAKCEMVIAMRYHACMFSFIANKPLLAIESYPSVEKFVEKNCTNFSIKPCFINEFELFFNNFMRFRPQYNVSLEDAQELAVKGLQI